MIFIRIINRGFTGVLGEGGRSSSSSDAGFAGLAQNPPLHNGRYITVEIKIIVPAYSKMQI
jgi:hypothetical protein